jgi:hypothetical protein
MTDGSAVRSVSYGEAATGYSVGELGAIAWEHAQSLGAKLRGWSLVVHRRGASLVVTLYDGATQREERIAL